MQGQSQPTSKFIVGDDPYIQNNQVGMTRYFPNRGINDTGTRETSKSHLTDFRNSPENRIRQSLTNGNSIAKGNKYHKSKQKVERDRWENHFKLS